MKASRLKIRRTELFQYSLRMRSRSSVKSSYLRWREEQHHLYECEVEGCSLNGRAEWGEESKKLVLIMDHKDGNPRNNNYDNLRLICPNCNSQLPTHGGRNRHRVLENYEDGYLLKDGNYKLFLADSINLMADLITIRIGPA